MRTLLALLALGLALPAAAQDDPSPDPAPRDAGPYAELGISGGYGGSGVGVIAASEAAIGYRLPSGLSLGGHVAISEVGVDHRAFAFGPEVRYARTLDARTDLDLFASGSVGFYRGTAFAADGFRSTGLGAQLGGSATRRYDLGRGITFAATGGLFGGLGHAFENERAEVGIDAGGPEAYAGVVVGAQLEFEVLGTEVAVGPRGSIPLVWTGTASAFGTGAHRVGGGPSGGFLTIRF